MNQLIFLWEWSTDEENLYEEPLEIIEVQTGTYFGEDDIERFDDVYGRVTPIK